MSSALQCQRQTHTYSPNNITQDNKVIETEFLVQGHKHVSASEAQTCGPVILSLALFHWTTLSDMDILSCMINLLQSVYRLHIEKTNVL